MCRWTLSMELSWANETEGCSTPEGRVSVHSVLRQKRCKKDVRMCCRTKPARSQTSFWLMIGWLDRSLCRCYGDGNSNPLSFAEEEKKQKKGLQWTALRSTLWMRWENILTWTTHHGGIFKMAETRWTAGRNSFPGRNFFHSLLSTDVYRTDHNLYLPRLLILHRSKIKFKISSCYSNLNVSQHLDIFFMNCK